IAVDPVADVAAAVDEPADVPTAAAVPRAVDMGTEPVLARGVLAHARARGRREWVSVRVSQEPSLGVDRASGLVDRPAEVVHRLPVGRAEREPTAVDPRKPDRVRARASRVDVAAEVEGLGLL